MLIGRTFFLLITHLYFPFCNGFFFPIEGDFIVSLLDFAWLSDKGRVFSGVVFVALVVPRVFSCLLIVFMITLMD